jgi:outer membrane protein OmpA-like peptidoglycan-associated protein
MNVTPTLCRVSLLAAAVIAAGCASTPRIHSEVAMLQGQLRDMRSDQRIAPHAAVELREAEHAVQVLVDGRRMRPVDFDQNLYLAKRLVGIAGAEGLARHAVQEGLALDRERETMLVEARTREADNARRMAAVERARADDAERAGRRARGDAQWARRDADDARLQAEQDRIAADRDQRAASLARSDADHARSAADMARSDADSARSDAERDRGRAASGQRNAELARAEADAARADAAAARNELRLMQTELADLNARQTERGLVVTVGDVLFETDRAELRGGAQRELDRLANALRDRTGFDLVIEGHTDSTGTAAHNQDLSERRADSVRRYLVAGGISRDRTSSSGLGQHHPVASNDNAGGRQQNRRVEIVIQQPEPARVSVVERD